jgi:hypothetical protein
MPCDSDDNCPKNHACRTFFADQMWKTVDKRCVGESDSNDATLNRLSQSNQVRNRLSI